MIPDYQVGSWVLYGLGQYDQGISVHLSRGGDPLTRILLGFILGAALARLLHCPRWILVRPFNKYLFYSFQLCPVSVSEQPF